MHSRAALPAGLLSKSYRVGRIRNNPIQLIYLCVNLAKASQSKQRFLIRRIRISGPSFYRWKMKVYVFFFGCMSTVRQTYKSKIVPFIWQGNSFARNRDFGIFSSIIKKGNEVEYQAKEECNTLQSVRSCDERKQP